MEISTLEGGLMALHDGQESVRNSELTWLHNQVAQLAQGAVVVEIGTWFGRSALALYTPDKLLVCVDTFQGTEGEKTGEIAKSVDVFSQFQANLDLAAANIAVMRCGSLQAVSCFADSFIDVYWHDGDHFHVYDDLVAWNSKVKPKGLRCGHDYTWQSVRQQVAKFAYEFGYKINLVDPSLAKSSIWYLETK